ncbi:MAG: hypothetical protein J5934_01320 [Succinivibrio sp.]|nr:hypothetical protein [Succinivibrio sp.]
MTNTHGIFVTSGASNHAQNDRSRNDLYTTDPQALERLLAVEQFSHRVWEPACGLGHLSEVLRAHGHEVFSSDITDHGYSRLNRIMDFLGELENSPSECDIITNPPYSQALEFAERSLELISPGHRVCLFLRLQFLEGKKRREFFRNSPPKTVYVFPDRMNCINPFGVNQKQSAIAYAWYIWEKGFKGEPVIRWL